MAVNQVNSTTLTVALAAGDIEFTVNSTTNISVGNMLLVAGRGGLEAMKVQAIPVSGRIQVLRGWAGTKARAHQNGAIVYIGTPDTFKAIRDASQSVGPYQIGLVGDAGPLPDYLLPGQRARDGAGNEYVLVDLQATVYTGVAVLIDSAHDGTFFAAVLAAGNQGAVGVMAEEGTSNQFAWAQVYGYTTAQDAGATSAGDSTYIPTAATSVSTPAAGMAISANTSGIADAYVIKGMFVVGAATTATTSATSHTGVQVPVWLNYPYVESTRTLITS